MNTSFRPLRWTLFEAAGGLLGLCLLGGCHAGDRPGKGGPWAVPELGMVMNWVPAGRGWIGSTPEERAWAEGPEGMAPRSFFGDEGLNPRQVIFKKGFWLGRTEVTVGQWRWFVEETGYRTEAEKRGESWCYDAATRRFGYMKGLDWQNAGFPFPLRENHPVTHVTWNDAALFCVWLTAREQVAGRLPRGYEYRLPGEAEWEYACRGHGDRTFFWWGSEWTDGQGRMNGAGQDADESGTWDLAYPWEDGYKFIAPVDSFGLRGRNTLGLADMLGNVWEWCLDGYDPQGGHAGHWTGRVNRRVLKGGAFDDRPGYLRCAVRAAPSPDDPNFARGFRVCLGVKVSP